MSLKTVAAGDLEIAYFEVGPADGPPVILLHGFPYDAHCYDAVAAVLAAKGQRVICPFLRGFGPTRFLSTETIRSGQQAAIGSDLLGLMEALGVKTALLGGFDWGGRAACIAAALWPERVRGLLTCGAGYNIQDIAASGIPAPAEEEARYWYIYYLHTERGRRGLAEDRRGFCHYIWRTWSPSWAFDAATFDSSAASFENPDFVEIVVHSYRHRYALMDGDRQFDAIEAALSEQPPISVPTIWLEGATDGVDPPGDPAPVLAKFTGPIGHHVLPNVGHNPPQEAPEIFAEMLLKLA